MFFILNSGFAQVSRSKPDTSDSKNPAAPDPALTALSNANPSAASEAEEGLSDRGTIVRRDPATEKRYRNDIHIRAIRDFRNNFRDVDNETWNVVKLGFTAYFKQDHIGNWVYYDRKGNWLYTMRSYEEDKLPRNIRAQVKSTYYDYSIGVVREIRSKSGITYVVHIEDKNGFKQLRIDEEGGMDVILDADRAK